MLNELIMLAATTSSNVSPLLVNDVANDAYAVAMSEEPLWNNGQLKTGKLLVVMAGRESAGNATVIGDSGAAHGAMQIHPRVWGRFLEERGFDYTVYYERRDSMRAMLAIVRHLTERCGSVKRALYAYASGSCFGNVVAKPKMEARCALIGGC